MIVFFKIFYESFRQAFSSLVANKLRTFLSLLGIAIGIFCIISVLSAVNSLKDSVKGGLGELGNDVIIIDVMPWGQDPGDNFWKYLKRPAPNHNDYLKIKEKLSDVSTAALAMFVDGRTIKYKSSSVQGAFTIAATFEYPEVQSMDIASGRYFTQSEYNLGANKVILGYKVATELFGSLDPVGRDVKLFGQKFNVIGTLKEEGDNPFNLFNYDEGAWIGYNTAKRFINVKESNRMNGAKFLYIKAKEGIEMPQLKDEVIGGLRQIRSLKPREENNFAVNELTMLNEVIDNIFKALYIAGGFIGFFALLVGMVSVANIMFVSVKERTNIIGIKKALGATRKIILLEFLIESVILCLIGGIIGLSLVYLVLLGLSSVLPFEISATFTFMLIGVLTSIVVGIIAGVIPAIQASNLDPVEAIRA